MTEYTISDDFRKDGLDRADATPDPGVDLGALNSRNLRGEEEKMYQEQATPNQTRNLIRVYVKLARRARITERKMAASLYTGRALELYTRRNG